MLMIDAVSGSDKGKKFACAWLTKKCQTYAFIDPKYNNLHDEKYYIRFSTDPTFTNYFSKPVYGMFEVDDCRKVLSILCNEPKFIGQETEQHGDLSY